MVVGEKQLQIPLWLPHAHIYAHMQTQIKCIKNVKIFWFLKKYVLFSSLLVWKLYSVLETV